MANNNALYPVFTFAKRNGGKKALVKRGFWHAMGWFYSPFKARVDLSSVGRVVFVCKGNICRSAVAEHAFKRVSAIACCSAGLDTILGGKANDRIATIAEKHQIDLACHATTPLDASTLTPLDLIVCMEPAHFLHIRRLNKNSKIVLLGHYGTPPKTYIHDPYSSSDEYAAECVVYLKKCTERLAQLLSAA